MKKIRFWAIGLCLVLLLSSVGILTASANATLSEGVCGENVRWSLDTDTGELTISGEGAINDYSPLYFPIWLNTSIAITSVTVEEGITALGQYTFVYCFDLTEVTLPDSLEVLPAHVFDGCRSLTSIQLPASLTEVGEGAFNGCEGLTEVILPEGVTTVGNKAFQGCTALDTVVLPSTLTSLGDDALAGATPETVLFKGDAEAWASVAAGSDNEALTDVLEFHTEHSFDREVAAPRYLATEATCYESALYYKSCICGEAHTETFSFGDPAGHRGGEATCLEPATCAFCGESYGELADHTPGAEATCTEDQLCTVCQAVLTEKLGHDYKDTVTPPTCVDEGFTTHVCARCADEYTDTPVDALGHTEGPAATCTEDQICTVCNEVLTEKLGHSYVDEVTLPPTCVDSGVRTHTCSVCDYVYFEAMDPLGHTEGPAATCTRDQLCTVCDTVLAEKFGHDYTNTVVEPTCTEQGYTSHACGTCLTVYHDAFVSAKGHTEGPAATCTEDQLCTDCGALLAEKTGHSYTEKVVEPTCTTQGYTLHRCEVCGDTYRDSFTDANGHTEGPAATCTENQICTVCEIVLIPALGHENTDTVVDPTCNLPGYTQHTCARCQTTYRDTVTPATGHTPGAAPTCTDAQTCTACGEILTQKLGHDYRSAVVASTCTTPGYISHECALCHATYRDSYTAAAGHNPGVPATCTTPQLCTVCNHVISPALGHDYEDTVTPPTCTDGGYTVHDCKVCDHVYVGEPTEALGHKAGPEATCTAPQTCTVCGALLAEKLTHIYEDTVIPPTCEEDGHTAHTCTLCGHVTLTDFTPATGHTSGDWVIIRDPDVGISGRKHKVCETCETVLEAETFWAEQETTPTEPGDTIDHNTVAPGTEEEGFKITGGNIVVIVIVLVAAFLLWFVDMKRK